MSVGGTGEDAFVRLRHELHRAAELSGREVSTAEQIREQLESLAPDALVTGLAGHGLAASWRSASPGVNVLLRCELDALPIPDPPDLPHASRTAGVAHKCGHDGHMALMVAAAARLKEHPPARGTVTLLFQPAEETGQGGARVLEDPAFGPFRPDVSLAVHNLPGFPLGAVILRDDVFAFGSVGAEIHLTGVESHAAEPERGVSPAAAVAALIQALQRVADPASLPPEKGAVTVTHVQVGEPAFGTSPGSGRVFATLRAGRESDLSDLQRAVETAVSGLPSERGLRATLSWREPFPVTRVDAAVVSCVEACARDLGLPVIRPPSPFRWSEDFGHFTSRFPGALFGLGSGQDHPPLHHPDYDFPDELIGIGAALVAAVVPAVAADASEHSPAGDPS